MRLSRHTLPAMVFALIVAATQSVWSQEPATLKSFFGEYEGFGITMNMPADTAKPSRRDLGVVIRPFEPGGFSMSWTTFIGQRGAGKKRKRTTTMNFVPSGKPRIWYSEPWNTLKLGGPTMWARLTGRSLVVYVVSMTKSGGTATAVYTRTLTDKGMMLEFDRATDGRTMRTVQAMLKRKK